MAAMQICCIEGCGKKHYGRGWCSAHFTRWRRHSDPLAGKIEPGLVRKFFDEAVLSYQGDDCLFWPYAKDKKGYARVNILAKSRLVHREVCIAVNGGPPTSAHLAAHKCGKGHLGCVNPRHISWKTPKENQADMIEHGTRARGEDHSASKLTEADVLKIRAVSLPQKQMAQTYGVSQSTISQIKGRKRWDWL